MSKYSEAGVLDAFSKLWGTDELLVSFDGINMTIPEEKRVETEPWPHIDQSPERKGLVCAQGIINFAPNGPHDGGLIVLKKSHNLVEQFFHKHPETIGRQTWGPKDWFGFTQEEMTWFKDRGGEVVKVCAGPGDLIIWDSRTVHWNTLPETEQVRSIICKDICSQHMYSIDVTASLTCYLQSRCLLRPRLSCEGK